MVDAIMRIKKNDVFVSILFIRRAVDEPTHVSARLLEFVCINLFYSFAFFLLPSEAVT